MYQIAMIGATTDCARHRTGLRYCSAACWRSERVSVESRSSARAASFDYRATPQGEFLAIIDSVPVLLTSTLPDSWASSALPRSLANLVGGVQVRPIDQHRPLLDTLLKRQVVGPAAPIVVLGLDALSKLIVRMDFASESVQMSQAQFALDPPTGAAVAIDLHMKHGFPTFVAQLEGGMAHSMLLDTAGAMAYWPAHELPAAVPGAVSDWHPYVGDFRPEVQGCRVAFGAGLSVEAPMARLPRPFAPMLGVLECKGSIGLSVLRQFAWVELRLREQRVYCGVDG